MIKHHKNSKIWIKNKLQKNTINTKDILNVGTANKRGFIKDY